MENAIRGPVTLSIERSETLSRGHLLLKVLFGWIYAGIPHGVILFLYGIVVFLIYPIAAVAILFTGRFPEGLFNIVVGYHRWALRLDVYLGLITDQYPPFSPNHRPDHPVLLYIDYPEKLSRWHMVLKFFLGWIYAGIPHAVVLFLYSIAVSLALIISFFAILFTREYPEGMFRFVEEYHRWGMRLNAYLGLMSDQYPPFSGRP